MESSDRVYQALARETVQKSANIIQQLSNPKTLKPTASADATHKRTLLPKVELDATVARPEIDDRS